jgi:excisionase family DNA binding protein
MATETMSIDAVAVRFGVSPWTVRTWIRLGRVPHYKVGRRVLISAADVEALLARSYKPSIRPA